MISLSAGTAAGQTNPIARSDLARTPDGQPDIQGIWEGQGGSYDIELGPDVRHTTLQGQEQRPYKSMIVDPPDGRIPYQPWAMAIKKDHFDNHTDPKTPDQVDGLARCFLGGVPRLMYQSPLMQIIQPAGYVVILLEFTHGYRVIPLREEWMLPEGAKLWMGDSRGRWDGNTLMIETRSLDGRTWFDAVGNFHSDAMRVTERLTFVNPETIHYEATMVDPQVYTKPWKLAFDRTRVHEAGFQLLEDACHEGNRFGETVPAANGKQNTSSPGGLVR
jgi:hypothetical protein